MKGCIFERPPGSGRWAIKYDEPRGEDCRRKTRWKTVHGSKRDAQKELRRLLHEIDQGAYVSPQKLTVADALRKWLADYAKPRVAAKTYERYNEIIEKHLIPALGATALPRLAPGAIASYYATALQSGRRRGNGGLSAQTVKHHHRVLSEAMRSCVKWRMLALNPCDAVDPPKPQRRDMQVLDATRSAGLLNAIAGDTIEIPVVLALMTGMRRGEILGLRWQDVNLANATLSVTQSLEDANGVLSFKAPKTNRSRRMIALPSLAVEALRRHRVQQGENRLKLGPIYQDQGLVCAALDGRPMVPRELTKRFSRLSGRLKLGVRLHDLRHSHITHLLAAGVHPKVASERAGHSSVAITMDVYSHVLPGMQEDAAQKIDDALRTALEQKTKA